MDTKERGPHERKKHWPVEFCGSPGWVDIAYCVFRHEAYPSRQYAFLVIYGLICGLGVCLGALIGWKERKLKSTKK